MGTICAWDFCSKAAQDIERLVGQAVYRHIGQRTIYALQLLCSDSFGIVRYANDEDILATIDEIKKEMATNGRA